MLSLPLRSDLGAKILAYLSFDFVFVRLVDIAAHMLDLRILSCIL